MEIKAHRKPVPVGNTCPYRLYPCTRPSDKLFSSSICSCACFDTTVKSFEGLRKMTGTCLAIHSPCKHFCSVGGMGCTRHNPVSFPLFYMFLCIFWHLFDIVWTSCKDDRHTFSASFAMWSSLLSRGMGCTRHNPVSFLLFYMFLCIFWRFCDIVWTSCIDDRHAFSTSFAMCISFV
jgi:hypothetical protein